MEHDEQAERLEREAQDMEQRSAEVGDRIEETKRDWEAKEEDPSVPGARPDPERVKRPCRAGGRRGRRGGGSS